MSMYPPAFETVSANAAVQASLGTSPCRFYLFNEAPENATKPYAVWALTTGEPENYLESVPDIDVMTIQVEVFGSSPSQCRAAAEDIRNAFEPVAYMISFGSESQEPDTNDYSYTMVFDWWVQR